MLQMAGLMLTHSQSYNRRSLYLQNDQDHSYIMSLWPLMRLHYTILSHNVLHYGTGTYGVISIPQEMNAYQQNGTKVLSRRTLIE